MKAGRLFLDNNEDRLKIQYADGTQSDGLHCGAGIEYSSNGTWKPTRVECDCDGHWYLVDAPDADLGSTVRM